MLILSAPSECRWNGHWTRRVELFDETRQVTLWLAGWGEGGFECALLDTHGEPLRLSAFTTAGEALDVLFNELLRRFDLDDLNGIASALLPPLEAA